MGQYFCITSRGELSNSELAWLSSKLDIVSHVSAIFSVCALSYGIEYIVFWDTLSHNLAQQSIQLESYDSLAFGLGNSGINCTGAAQVFPHHRVHRATLMQRLATLYGNQAEIISYAVKEQLWSCCGKSPLTWRDSL